jgi:uncharacterized lipoprotein NlpE involved in copper resistance
MTAKFSSKKVVVPLVLMLLSLVGCATQSQPDARAASEVAGSHVVHPNREPTMDDVQAGTACVQAPVTVIMWIENDKTYTDGIYCKFKVG